MKFVYGSLWENLVFSDGILVPASRTLDKEDRVLTFSPELQRAQEILPEFPQKLGSIIEGLGSYYGSLSCMANPTSVILLQNRTHFRNSPSLSLFKESISCFNIQSSLFKRVSLSYPEEFLAYYTPKEIYDVLLTLSENTVVWVPRPMKKKPKPKPSKEAKK